MAKRTFGGYPVYVQTIRKPVERSDELIETKTLIRGDIEIGIQIEPMTWREDWLAQQVFGKKEAGNYRLINVENNWIDKSDRANLVTAVWRKIR